LAVQPTAVTFPPLAPPPPVAILVYFIIAHAFGIHPRVVPPPPGLGSFSFSFSFLIAPAFVPPAVAAVTTDSPVPPPAIAIVASEELRLRGAGECKK